MKCEICRQEPSPTCNWQQGRCPFQMPVVGSGLGLFVGYVVAAVIFCIMIYGFVKILRLNDLLY